MLLKEILLDANLLVPNSINDETKVRWLNEIQGQLYRDFPFPDTSFSFTAEPGFNLYLIPVDCSRERITSVIVGNDIYDYRTVDQEETQHCWTIIDNHLFIHPAPNQNTTAFLNYRPAPKEMLIAMQDIEPTYPSDFHEVLVYGIAARIARSLQDTNRALELKAYSDELHDKAQKDMRPSRNKVVQMNRSWR